MITSDKQIRLTGFLGQLPPGIAERLAKAVEVDRMVGGKSLPHEVILEALKPKLGANPPPPPSHSKAVEDHFRAPFEDLLTDDLRKAKKIGRIACAAADRAWSWLTQELIPDQIARLSETLDTAIAQGNEPGIKSARLNLWREAAVALKEALAGDAEELRRALGSEDMIDDVKEIALLLGNVREILRLHDRFPKPTHSLSDGMIAFVRESFDRLAASNAEFLAYIPLIVMGRLEHPWETLRLAAALARKSDDTVLAASDLGIAGELLFEDLDMYAMRIQSVRPLDFHVQTLLEDLKAFSLLSGGMVREIDIRRDGRWGHKLAKDRASVAAVMENLIERAPKEIFAGLPAVKVGTFSKGPKPLDVGRVPEPERVKRALSYAQLLSHARPLAEAAAFKAKLDEVFEETVIAIRAYNEDILREVRTAPVNIHPIAQQNFATALEVCTYILGEAEAGFLRRRSRVPING